ncbi:Retrotransposable element Tf2 [Gossypium australe]|uniref:Retrotransposable element Tf2 n=1 Tax=Gossypium australe TaxID=47621 RepID=A0A5B6X417_9ROSI|nr:Retrotransposable element Tf2 [Gossypium australe]
MDFIEGLPKSKRKSMILVVLNGLPDSIIFDKDRIFVSNFWQDFFKRVGNKLHLSTAYHPKIDGQIEVLRGISEVHVWRKARGLAPLAPLAKWWYNSTQHSASRTTPYKALYRQPTPHHVPYLLGASPVFMVDRTLQQREAARKIIQFHLKKAQDRMKQQAEKHRTKRQFGEGDLRQHSIRRRWNQKLSPKYFSHFVIARVGKVAYRLLLPPATPVQNVSPVVDASGAWVKEPAKILDRRIIRKGNQAVTEVLIEWVNTFSEDVIWEPFEQIRTKFPWFDP